MEARPKAKTRNAAMWNELRMLGGNRGGSWRILSFISVRPNIPNSEYHLGAIKSDNGLMRRFLSIGIYFWYISMWEACAHGKFCRTKEGDSGQTFLQWEKPGCASAEGVS